jgi:6-phosphogluconolactonase
MSPDICVLPSVEGLHLIAAERFVQIAQRVVRRSRRFCVALAGGATPQGLYRRLGQDPLFREAVPWA